MLHDLCQLIGHRRRAFRVAGRHGGRDTSRLHRQIPRPNLVKIQAGHRFLFAFVQCVYVLILHLRQVFCKRKGHLVLYFFTAQVRDYKLGLLLVLGQGAVAGGEAKATLEGGAVAARAA